MAIELQMHDVGTDNPYRSIQFGEDPTDWLSVIHCDPESCSEQEFRTKVFDILWQLAGGKYD